jgi:hypothetical protein
VAAQVEELSTWLLVCEYGPGGNLEGELPFSPTVAAKLGLDPEPCDGPLSPTESAGAGLAPGGSAFAPGGSCSRAWTQARSYSPPRW